MLTEKRSLIFDVYEQKLTRLTVDAFFHMKRIGRKEEPASLILVLPKQVSPQSNHKYVEENRPGRLFNSKYCLYHPKFKRT